ncbi:MAG: hypothetical protein OEM60_12305 [Gammaproteobacteria bacterium]|nr:hypothetical protein [Gammaproteobacteria bacterium]MDH3434638.1 hypothetical protein [Gammaproteobacteria bacterium]
MTSMIRLILTVLSMTAIALAGCGNGSVDTDGVDRSPGAKDQHTFKPQGPVMIDYKIIGTPVVGQPVAIELQVKSTLGPQPITLSYRVNDSTAMQFTEAQPASVSIAASKDQAPSQQQVRVIPMREGRLFLNVSASIDTESGLLSSVTAIPIQVGAAPRVLQENGELLRDESGELIHSLPARENDPQTE